MLTNLLFFLLFGLILLASGIFLVKSLIKIALFLKISEFVAAFIIMAFATSVPELFVGISSAISGEPSLSLGNVLGANILDLTLIMGIIILASRGIDIKSRKIGRDIYLMIFVVLLVTVLYLAGNSLSRIDGAILLCVFAYNVWRMLKRRKRYTAKIDKESVKKLDAVLNAGIFVIAIIVLFLSSQQIVKYATNLAIDLSLPEIVIGIFLISFATTLPELVFGISAARLDHREMGLGDQVGTIILNSTLVLGLVALICPVSTDLFPFLASSIFLFISSLIFIVFAKTGRRLGMIEGILLILLYVFFIIIQFFLKP